MNNFYLVDKPLGISSFDVIRQLRKKIGIKKMGHTGTLDPLASGVLLIATGNYTKLVPYLEKERKSYMTTIALNGTTASYDLGEEVEHISDEELEGYKKKLTRQYIEGVLQENFLGKIKQTPPKFSAVKVNGKRAYERARKGEDVNIKEKPIEIFNIKILNYEYPFLGLELEVSAGTYIRSIARDLGTILGTGGYLTALRRTGVGHLGIEKSVALDGCTEESSIGVQELFDEKYFLHLDDDGKGYGNGILSLQDIERLNNGLPRIRHFEFKIGIPYFVFDGREILNVVEYDGEQLKGVRKIC